MSLLFRIQDFRSLRHAEHFVCPFLLLLFTFHFLLAVVWLVCFPREACSYDKFNVYFGYEELCRLPERPKSHRTALYGCLALALKSG